MLFYILLTLIFQGQMGRLSTSGEIVTLVLFFIYNFSL